MWSVSGEEYVPFYCYSQPPGWAPAMPVPQRVLRRYTPAGRWEAAYALALERAQRDQAYAHVYELGDESLRYARCSFFVLADGTLVDGKRCNCPYDGHTQEDGRVNEE